MRLFIALDLSEEIRARVAEAVERERARVDAKWARPEKLHLTLVFFGSRPPEKLGEIVAGARRVAATQPELRLGIEGAGTFGPPRRPRVLWLGLTGQVGPLLALVARLEQELGVVSDRPEHRPHLTLGRALRSRGDPLLLEVAGRLERTRFGEWSVDHLTVYESAGGRYRPLATIPFACPPVEPKA